MVSNSSKTLIHTALLCEAQPLIQLLKLTKNKTVPHIYENETHLLVVSGMGKKATLKTISEIVKTHSFHKAINLGIAGCKDEQIAIGTLCCTTHTNTTMPYVSLGTHDTPVEDKSSLSTTLVDMEAQYFMQVCQEYLSKEQIYCLKVVSDYCNSTIPSKAFVNNLIQQNILKIKEIL
jgi:nucleoside phosphorylase